MVNRKSPQLSQKTIKLGWKGPHELKCMDSGCHQLSEKSMVWWVCRSPVLQCKVIHYNSLKQIYIFSRHNGPLFSGTNTTFVISPQFEIYGWNILEKVLQPSCLWRCTGVTHDLQWNCANLTMELLHTNWKKSLLKYKKKTACLVFISSSFWGQVNLYFP